MIRAGTPSFEELLQKASESEIKRLQHKYVNSYWGERRRVSSVVQNRGPNDAEFTLSLSGSESTTTTTGFKISADFGISKSFSVGFEASYSKSWTWTKTITETYKITVRPGHQAWIEWSPLMYMPVFDVDFGFHYPFYDHYLWYITDVCLRGGASDQAGKIELQQIPISKFVLDNPSKYTLVDDLSDQPASDVTAKTLASGPVLDMDSLKNDICDPNHVKLAKAIHELPALAGVIYADRSQ